MVFAALDLKRLQHKDFLRRRYFAMLPCAMIADRKPPIIIFGGNIERRAACCAEIFSSAEVNSPFLFALD
jgi:hypothetical protein